MRLSGFVTLASCKHINDSDLWTLERVIENLVAEMDTQEEGEGSRV